MDAVKMGKQQRAKQQSGKAGKTAARAIRGKYHENQRVVLVCIADGPTLPHERPIVVGVGCWQQRFKAREAERRRLGLFPTADPADRAHGVEGIVDSGHGGKTHGLVPAEDLGDAQAKPRRYPASQMAGGAKSVGREGRRVAIDSVYDDTYERQKRLAGIPGVGVRTQNVGPQGKLRHCGDAYAVDVRGEALAARDAAVRVLESSRGKREMFTGVLRK